MSRKILVGDQVEVIAGSAKGQRGAVRDIVRRRRRDGAPDPEQVYVVVEGVNMRWKHQRNTGGRTQTQRGIIEIEAPVHVSNVAVLGSDDRPTRVGMRFDNNEKVRFDRRSGEAIARPAS